MVARLNDGFKLNSEELEGPLLDFYIGRAFDHNTRISKSNKCCIIVVKNPDNSESRLPYSPSTRWMQGGPLIDLEHISFEFQGYHEGMTLYAAYYGFDQVYENETVCYGQTPLMAAMRCIVKERIAKYIDPERYPILEEV